MTARPAPAPVLMLDDVAIGHDPAAVLASEVSFTLEPGGIVCLMGPNGIGKTTLLRTVLGLIPPLAGRVIVDGLDVVAASASAVARAVAHVPQAFLGDPGHTVFDVVLMGRTGRLGLFAVPGREDRRAASEALEALGLSDLADRRVDRISGGQRQLMLIARALAQDTPVVVMDEPTASLDLGNRWALVDRIRVAAADGRAVIVSTHEPEQAFEFADRVAVLGHDRRLAVGPVDEILTTERLAALYRTDVRLETTACGRRVVVRADAEIRRLDRERGRR